MISMLVSTESVEIGAIISSHNWNSQKKGEPINRFKVFWLIFMDAVVSLEVFKNEFMVKSSDWIVFCH